MSVMKAARLFRVGDFRTVGVEVPQPAGEELLVKIGACGVCGSDLPRVYEKGSSNGKYPLTLGHEFSGEIVDAGDKADKSLIGKRGAFYPLIPCRDCDSCVSGEYAMCSDYDYMGSRRDGGFAEYCLVPGKWHFVESRGEADFDSLSMVEPASVAQHAVRKSGAAFGSRAVVFGAGPIGMMAARWLEVAGAEVLLADIADSKIKFAGEHGAKCLNSASSTFGEELLDVFHGSADIAIEATGASAALENAVRVMKPFGRVVLVGNPIGDMTLSQDAYGKILRKELTLSGIWNSHFSPNPIDEWDYTVRMLDSGKFRCGDLITHRVGVADLPGLVERMRKREVSVCKAVYDSTLD